MWCIGRITAEYRRRMYELLGLYAKPYARDEPVVCLDEKSKQLLNKPAPIAGGRPGPDWPSKITNTGGPAPATCSWRWSPRPRHRGGGDPPADQAGLCGIRAGSDSGVYAKAKLHLVLDNLNTHFRVRSRK